MVLTLETDGPLCVQAASAVESGALLPLIVLAFSGRTSTTLVKEAAARISTTADPTWLVGNMM